MLALRLVRGAHPLATLRRLLVATATAGVGFLLLSALGHATAHPGRSGESAVRLLWCLVPLAATVQLAVAVARTETSGRALTGLDAAGMGPSRMPLLAAVSAGFSCVLGSAGALLAFLYLRGGTGVLPLDGAAAGLLAAHRPLPVGAALTLLAVAPLAAAAASAFALRARPLPAGRQEGPRTHSGESGASTTLPVPAPAGLPWGTALAATGLMLETLAGRAVPPGGGPVLLPLPGSLNSVPPGVLGGWLVTGAGLVLAGPGLTHLCGRLIAMGRPGALRLLSGRMLQTEAARIGRPLGVLCAVAAGALAAVELYGTAPAGGAPVFGPLTGLGVALVMCCATASALTAAAESRALRTPVTATLLQLGASRSLLVRAAVLRTAALVAVLAPVAWATGELAALPLRHLAG